MKKKNQFRREAQINNKKSNVELAKVMNNAPFVKTIENVKKRSNIKLLQPKYDDRRIKQQMGQRIFKELKKINENLYCVHKNPISVTLDKPIFVGQAILDISKELM